MKKIFLNFINFFVKKYKKAEVRNYWCIVENYRRSGEEENYKKALLKAAKGYEELEDWSSAAYCYEELKEENKYKEMVLKTAWKLEKDENWVIAAHYYKKIGKIEIVRNLYLKAIEKYKELKDQNNLNYCYQEFENIK